MKYIHMWLENFLIQIWYKKRKRTSYVLYPFSWIYIAIIKLRRWLYQIGIKKVIYFPVPIVIVGNITVGGTGKTSFTLWLTSFLQKKGLMVGIVSRGYKGAYRATKPILVTKDSHVLVVGDEPFLLASRLQCPVVVHSDRVKATAFLLSQHHCDIVISDDGLQHYALGRDMEIVVIDADRYLGNGFCLPAGPLREPVSRLKTVDFVISKSKINQQQQIPNTISMNIEPETFVSVSNFRSTISIYSLCRKKVHALSGIGNPDHFFETLKDIGIDSAVMHIFPDHHHFTYQDIDIKNADFIIMTEKDAVKCRDFADERHWFLKVNPSVCEDFGEIIFNRLLRSQV